jgi:hypothetical protein
VDNGSLCPGAHRQPKTTFCPRTDSARDLPLESPTRLSHGWSPDRVDAPPDLTEDERATCRSVVGGARTDALAFGARHENAAGEPKAVKGVRTYSGSAVELPRNGLEGPTVRRGRTLTLSMIRG